jgi:hypothetical protein
MQEKQNTWREFLGNLIQDSQEKQRIANDLNVKPITLTRWINGESDPRPQNLRHLLSALPQHRNKLLALILEEFHDFLPVQDEDVPLEIPSAFYARVLNAYSTTPKALRFWSVCNLILQQALGHLDYSHLGILIGILRCMPPGPKNGKIRSLRGTIALSSTPFTSQIEQQAIFVGAESLAGYSLVSSRAIVAHNIHQEEGIFPVHRVEDVASGLACPIIRDDSVAGCLFVGSHQPDYFLASSRFALIQYYTDLVSLAFDSDEFFKLDMLELREMPSYKIQEKYFANFRQRIARVMLDATASGMPLNLMQAENLVWQQLEEELLDCSANRNGC